MWQPGGQADMVDATLVQRFNEWNQDVTIHRPNILTLLSSAFVRGHPFFSLKITMYFYPQWTP